MTRMAKLDNESYLETLRLEDKYTKPLSAWEVAQAFPDCQDLASSVVECLKDLFCDSGDPVLNCFRKSGKLYKVYINNMKYLDLTKPIKNKSARLNVQKARQVPIESICALSVSKQSNDRIHAKCPFHDEKNGSFVVYRRTNTFHCFSCQANGSSIDFSMKLHNLDFKSAVLHLNGDL